jgi:hypothetical protein
VQVRLRDDIFIIWWDLPSEELEAFAYGILAYEPLIPYKA